MPAARIGIGGPVGSGKTALVEQLCKIFRESHDIAAVTNDIYTQEDAEYLVRHAALPAERTPLPKRPRKRVQLRATIR